MEGRKRSSARPATGARSPIPRVWVLRWGAAAWRALSALQERLPLDYFGVDFTRLPDGRLMVFEANPVMRIPYVDTVEFAFRKPYIIALQAALSDLLAARIGETGRGG